MMAVTKGAALDSFFRSFGIAAYERTRVPAKAQYPYLCYDQAFSAFEEGAVSLTVDLYFYGEDNTAPNALAQLISYTIGRGGIQLHCDDGTIWLKRGSPFCQSLRDPVDDRINRRYINITAEFITAD